MKHHNKMTLALISFRILSWTTTLPLVIAGFVCMPNHARCVNITSKLYSKKTLTEETTWRLRLVLNEVPTEKGGKVDEIITIEANFVEEPGYEPPQGSLREILKPAQSWDDPGPRNLKIAKSRWLLSEDPDDRKDGLWVWGLFREPLYPFLLLSFETSRVPVSGDDSDFIKPLQLYAQLSHKRDKVVGAILGGCDLKVREISTVNADPFGAATVDLYEEIPVGRINVIAL